MAFSTKEFKSKHQQQQQQPFREVSAHKSDEQYKNDTILLCNIFNFFPKKLFTPKSVGIVFNGPGNFGVVKVLKTFARKI